MKTYAVFGMTLLPLAATIRIEGWNHPEPSHVQDLGWGIYGCTNETVCLHGSTCEMHPEWKFKTCSCSDEYSGFICHLEEDNLQGMLIYIMIFHCLK